MMHDWSYDDQDLVRGPSKWKQRYPQVGQAQSPIDIQLDYCDLQKYQQQVNCSCVKLQRLDLNKTTAGSNHDKLARKQQGRHQQQNSGGKLNCNEDEENESQQAKSDRSAKVCSGLSSAHSGGLASGNAKSLLHLELHSKNSINTQQTRYCATNKKLFLGYPRYLNTVKLSNTGHAWQIDLPAELASHTMLSGPPLGDREYRLKQLHCHWGSHNEQGSEHLVNGRAYSAEIHFVHWNCKQFKTFEEAAQHKHGLAVLAVFVQALEGDEQNHNKHLDKIVAALPRVSERPHSSLDLTDFRLDLKKLFPTNRWLYASYEGSLTTPPLSEVVDWIVFLQPIQCSFRQIESFRQLSSSSTGEKLLKNWRPVQPINQRVVSIWTDTGCNS